MDIHSILIAVTDSLQQAAENLPEAVHAAETSSAADGGVLGTLGINWKLFVAQLVNFAIVLFIFWKWIVKPLGKTLTDRQNRIEQGLKNADLSDLEKKKFEEWKQHEMKKVRTDADQVLRMATDTANKIKQETIFDAQKQADKIQAQAQVAIQAEKEKAVKEARQELASLVVLASEKIIKEKLDPSKDKQLINDSIKEIT